MGQVRLALLSGVIALLGVSIVRGADVGIVVTRPLPIALDQETSPSGFYITLVEHGYHQQASVALKDNLVGSPEEALSYILKAIEKKQLDEYKKVVVEDEVAGSVQTFSLYCDLFQGTPDPVVEYRFDLGGAVYFVVGLKGTDVPGMAFVLVKDRKGWRNSFQALMHPICQEISLLSQQMKAEPARYATTPLPKGCRTVSLPPILGAEVQSLPSISFVGRAVDYYAFSPTTQPSSERPKECSEDAWRAMQSYSVAWADLKAGKMKDYLSHFGSDSREKLEKWIQQDPKAVEVFRQTVAASAQHVIYVLGEGAVYYMILEAPPNAGKVAAIAYDTLAKKDGSWVQVNLKTDTELDSMLKMPEVSKRILDELRHK